MAKRLLISILMILILTGGNAGAGGRTTLVVQEYDYASYNNVSKGFRSTWADEMVIIITEGKDAKSVMAEVERIGPDLILAIGSGGLRKVRDVGSVPIIYTVVLKPGEVIRDQLNIAGIGMKIREEEVMTVIRTAMPHTERIGLLCGEDDWVTVQKARAVAAGMGVSLIVKQLKGRSEIHYSIREMRPHIQVLWIIRNRLFNTETVKSITRYASEAGLPVVSFAGDHIEMDAFITVDLDFFDLGRQAAEMGAKALEGRNITSTVPKKAVVKLSRRMGLKLNIDFKVGDGWYLVD